jgi:hypothetical protein
MTDAERLSHGGLLELAAFPVGAHILSPGSLAATLGGRGRLATLENAREQVKNIGPYILAATRGRPLNIITSPSGPSPTRSITFVS